MRRFVAKSILFCALFGMLVFCMACLSATERFREVFAYLTESSDYYAGPEDEVAEYIGFVREEGDYTRLIVGDSVCNQMLNNMHDRNTEYCIAGNNRALTVAGEYLLVREFLELHEGITDVYLIIGLDALQADIDTTYGYGYVVIPFLRERMLQNLEEETLDEVEERFGYLFVQRPVAMLVGNSSVNRKLYSTYIKDHTPVVPYTGQIELSNLAATYLVKINTLCEEYGAVLHLLPDPLADNESRHIQEEGLKIDFAVRGLDELFPNYFNEIMFYPDEQFGDGIHFGEPYNEQSVMNEKIREMYLDHGYLDGIVLGE